MKLMRSIPVLFAMWLLACSDSRPASDPAVQGDTTPTTITPPGSRTPVTQKEYKARGLSFYVREDKSLGESVSRITVLASDSTFTDSLNLGDKDPVETCIIADLDNNKRDELYVITRSVGTGTFAHIFGFMRDEQNKLVAIEVPEVSPREQATGKKFEGYLGHDSIYVRNHELIRSFPAFRPGDNHNEPTGGKRTVRYVLEDATLIAE